jgi:hypothetical protein
LDAARDSNIQGCQRVNGEGGITQGATETLFSISIRHKRG